MFRSTRAFTWIALIIGVALALGVVALADRAIQHPPTSQSDEGRPTRTPVPGLKSVLVASVVGLKAALADDSVDDIVVADGTYHISESADETGNSLWIGSAYARRTRPVTVRARDHRGRDLRRRRRLPRWHQLQRRCPRPELGWRPVRRWDKPTRPASSCLAATPA